jgi:hypothetical protein
VESERALEVSVESESDSRGAFGISDVSTALSGLRMSIKIGARSPVSYTLREHPKIAIQISVV